LGKVKTVRKRYDFSKGRKNPYTARLKKQITIRLDRPTIQFFKEAAVASGIPYQTLINLYLRDCAQQGRKLSIEWRASA
jgi:predicted DNA binding CopG/RHH family protein